MDAIIKRLQKEKERAENKYRKSSDTYYAMRQIPFDKLTPELGTKFSKVCKDREKYDIAITKIMAAIENLNYANELLKF